MGMFASVYVDESIDLPHFPEELGRDHAWQSKQGLDVYDGPYRITADGRLEKEERSYRDKTEGEKQREAEKWGFDSWDEYVEVYEDNENALIPTEVDFDSASGVDDYPPVFPVTKKLDEEWWTDQNFHGTFEFHELIKQDPIEYDTVELMDGELEKPTKYALDVFIEYEARFTKGDLDEIVFMGERMADGDDPAQAAINKIEDWREWKQRQ